MARRRKSNTRKTAQEAGFRSAFEHRIAKQAEQDGIEFEYEPESSKLKWQPKEKTYLPDFVLDNGIVVEAKGRLTQQDRTKILHVLEQHPEVDLRLVFQYDNKLTRSSKTRYSDWCKRHGIPYAFGTIPTEWAYEKS